MNNKEYWHKRFINLEKQNNQKTAKYYADIEKTFSQVNKKIDAEISTWYRRFAVNNNISLTEAKRLLNSKELKELQWDINDYIKYGKENAINQQWLKQLENASAKRHITRLEALKLQTQQQIEVLYGNQLDSFDTFAKKLYSDNYYHTAFEIQKGFNIGYDLQQFSENHLEKVLNNPWTNDGVKFSSRIWNHKTELINTIQSELLHAVIKGESPDKAINNIAKKFNTSKSKAGRLVMTESSYISSIAQKDCYKELDVEKYEIIATLDSHTSKVCQDMDGTIFKLSDYESGATAPPFHPYCRSCTAPYFPDNYGERVARDKDGNIYYVPSDMKYHDWYKKFVEGESKEDLTPKVTLKDIKDVLINKVGFKSVDSSFDDIDDEIKIPITEQLQKLEKRFNCIHEGKRDIMSVNSDSIAYCTLNKFIPNENSLCLSKKFYTNKLDLINARKDSFNSKWCMPLDIDNETEAIIYNITHEYGHLLQFNFIQQAYIKDGWIEDLPKQFIDYSRKTAKGAVSWYTSRINKTCRNIKKEIINIAKKNNPKFDLNANLSDYGTTSDFEFFAETFANSQLSKPNELGKAMEEWLKQRGY